MPHGREFSIQERWHLQYGRGTQHRDPHRVPSAPFPEPQTPVSPRVSSLLCPPSAGAQCLAANKILCGGPFKKVLVSLADSHLFLVGRNCFFSQPDVMWAPLPLPGLGSPVWCLDPMLLRRNSPQLRYPSCCCLWEWIQPFLCLCPSYQCQHGCFWKSLVIRLLFSQSSVVIQDAAVII